MIIIILYYILLVFVYHNNISWSFSSEVKLGDLKDLVIVCPCAGERKRETEKENGIGAKCLTIKSVQLQCIWDELWTRSMVWNKSKGERRKKVWLCITLMLRKRPAKIKKTTWLRSINMDYAGNWFYHENEWYQYHHMCAVCVCVLLSSVCDNNMYSCMIEFTFFPLSCSVLFISYI